MDIVEPMDTPLTIAEKKIRDEEIKKLQNEATVEKKVTITQNYKKDVDPPTVLEIGLDETMIMGL